MFSEPGEFIGYDYLSGSLAKLCIGWRRSGNLCTIPEVVSGHCKELRKAPALEKGINLFQSMKIFELSKQLVPVGSGKQPTT